MLDIGKLIGAAAIVAAIFLAGMYFQRHSTETVSSDTTHAFGIGTTPTGRTPEIVGAPGILRLKDDTLRIQRSLARRLRRQLDSLLGRAFTGQGGDVVIEQPGGSSGGIPTEPFHDIIATMDTSLTRTVCLDLPGHGDTCLDTRDFLHVEYSLPFQTFGFRMNYGSTPVLRDTVKIETTTQTAGLSIFERAQWLIYGGGAMYAAQRIGAGEPAGQALAIASGILILKGLIFR